MKLLTNQLILKTCKPPIKPLFCLALNQSLNAFTAHVAFLLELMEYVADIRESNSELVSGTLKREAFWPSIFELKVTNGSKIYITALEFQDIFQKIVRIL